VNEGRTTADVVRAVIARAWLGPGEDEQIGEVVLRPHQHNAVARLRALLNETRGAMLADGVGLGKTFTALAAARHARRLLVVAPAALREMSPARRLRIVRSAQSRRHHGGTS
jgi:superfamily II DNA or RNA helicase